MISPENATHDYVGIAKCGCARAICVDMEDRFTRESVGEFMKSGLTIERMPHVEACARFTEKRECSSHPQRKEEPKQEALFG
jgi:hypothetical protein